MVRALIDTNIFIDNIRGFEPARRFLKGLKGNGCISAVTLTELHLGARSATESEAFEKTLSLWRVVSIDAAIARRAGVFLRLYEASHNVGLPDALIAASAEAEGAQLHTRNLKHFPMLKDAVAPY